MVAKKRQEKNASEEWWRRRIWGAEASRVEGSSSSTDDRSVGAEEKIKIKVSILLPQEFLTIPLV